MFNMKKYIVICDIDNCYTDSRDWVKHVPSSDITDKAVLRSMWDKYQAMSFLAKPNKSIIDLLLSMSDLIPVYFVTSRENRKHSREDTIYQIEKFSDGRILIGDTHKLYMRNEFDYRSSHEVKKDIVTSILAEGCIPVVAIDDDRDNCEMFAELGIPTKLYNIETDKLTEIAKPAAKV